MDDLDDLQRVSNVGLNDFLSVVEDVFRVSRRPLSEEPSSPNTSARHFRRGRSEHFSRGALELNKDNSIKLEFLPKGKRKRQKIPWEGNILQWKTLKQCSRSGSSVTPPLHHTIHNSPAAFSSVTPCTASPRAASSREPPQLCCVWIPPSPQASALSDNLDALWRMQSSTAAIITCNELDFFVELGDGHSESWKPLPLQLFRSIYFINGYSPVPRTRASQM